MDRTRDQTNLREVHNGFILLHVQAFSRKILILRLSVRK